MRTVLEAPAAPVKVTHTAESAQTRLSTAKAATGVGWMVIAVSESGSCGCFPQEVVEDEGGVGDP